MYFVIVILTTIVLPIGSAIAETWLYFQHLADQKIWIYPAFSDVAILMLGKWYVFWAGGVRLLLAGLRQTFQPSFTLKQIFGIDHKPSEHIVQELGFANLSMGLLCVLSLVWPGLAVAGAMVSGLYYGLAGLKHLTSQGERNAMRTLAMVTDLLVFAVLAVMIGLWLANGARLY